MRTSPGYEQTAFPTTAAAAEPDRVQRPNILRFDHLLELSRGRVPYINKVVAEE